MNLPTLSSSISRPALLLTLLFMSCAAADALAQAAYASESGPGRNYSAHYGPAAAPRAGCNVGDAVQDQAAWIDANGASTESDATRRVGASFSQPLAAKAMRVALNGDAMRNLALVEVQDANGAWHTVWKGKPDNALPKGCESVWFARKLEGRAPVAALRFTFGQSATRVEVGNAALLPAG